MKTEITEIETHRGSVNIKSLIRLSEPTEGAIRRLVTRLKQEQSLLASRLTCEAITELLQSNRAVAFGTCPQTIDAFGALWACKEKRSLELGTLWISERCRHRGIAPFLFQACDGLQPDKRLFLITAEPVVVAIAIRNGWRLEGNNWKISRTYLWEDMIIGPLWERYPPSALKEPGLLLYREARSGKVVCWT